MVLVQLNNISFNHVFLIKKHDISGQTLLHAKQYSSVGDKVVSAEVQTTYVMKKNLRIRMRKIDTEIERDREIGTKMRYIFQ